MKQKTFEQFMRDIHAKQYRGLDDEMPDDFSDWLSNMDIQQIVIYEEQFEKTKGEDYGSN